jgi:hypothetical protein
VKFWQYVFEKSVKCLDEKSCEEQWLEGLQRWTQVQGPCSVGNYLEKLIFII